MSPFIIGPSLLLTVIIAGLVLSSGPRRTDNRAFFAHSIFAAMHALVVGYLYLGDPLHPPSLEALQGALGTLWLASTVVFAWSFPGARRPPPKLWLPLGLVTGVVVALHLLTPLSTSGNALRIFAVSAIVLILLFLSRAGQRADQDQARGGVLLVQAAMFIRLALASGVFVFRNRVEGDTHIPLTFIEICIAPPMTSALIAFALMKYQLLDVRGFITRSIGLFAVTAVSGVVVVGAIELLQRLFSQLNLVPWGEGQILAPGLVILVLLAFNPLRMRLEQGLERWVNQSLVRAREAVAAYIQRTEGSLDVQALMAALDEAVAVILPGAQAAVLVSQPHERLLPTTSFGARQQAECPGAAVAVRALREGGRRWWTRVEEGMSEPMGPLRALEVDLVVPFKAGDKGDGALVLRARTWEVERLELLHQLALRLGLQLHNALLYQGALSANKALTQSNNELADTRLFLEAVVASLPVGLIVLGPDGHIRRWNASMERITGVRAEAAVGQQGLPPPLEGLGPLTQMDLTPGRANRRALRIHDGGRERVVQVNARVASLTTHAGRADGWVLLLSDVTELLRLQGELESSRRLAALGQLAAAMAHEIRTPLTSIKLNVQMLAGKMKLPEADAEHFDIVLEELERLNAYVTEILDYAKPLKLVGERADLAGLCEEVGRSMYFLLAEREVGLKVSFEGGTPPHATVDTQRLKQVIINLLDNASQATEARGDGSVTILLRPDEGPGPGGVPAAGVSISISDNGVGMDTDTLAQIFDPFFTTRPTGTGLGLAIARRIIRSHGGDITAESQPGVGTTFTVWLPLDNKTSPLF